MMLPSSLCHLPRCALLSANPKALTSARRAVSFGIGRPAHNLPLYAFEKRPARLLVTYAEAEEKEGAVASREDEMPPFKAKNVTADDWEEEVLKCPDLVFVDFWAPWCGPCRMIGPTIDELIEELGDKFKAVKVNTDKSPSVATDYGIRSIPTCMLFKDGKKVDTIIGAVKKPVLRNSIEKCLP